MGLAVILSLLASFVWYRLALGHSVGLLAIACAAGIVGSVSMVVMYPLAAQLGAAEVGLFGIGSGATGVVTSLLQFAQRPALDRPPLFDPSAYFGIICGISCLSLISFIVLWWKRRRQIIGQSSAADQTNSNSNSNSNTNSNTNSNSNSNANSASTSTSSQSNSRTQINSHIQPTKGVSLSNSNGSSSGGGISSVLDAEVEVGGYNDGDGDRQASEGFLDEFGLLDSLHNNAKPASWLRVHWKALQSVKFFVFRSSLSLTPIQLN